MKSFHCVPVMALLAAATFLIGCSSKPQTTEKVTKAPAPVATTGDTDAGSSAKVTTTPGLAGKPLPELPTGPASYKLGGSIYVGWMPWYHADAEGILDKWADKYGITIEFKPMDYIASVEAFVAGEVDACVMTNMECLDMPAASGVDSSVIIVGDYSNGNDMWLARNASSIEDLKGTEVPLVELSVSEYLKARALEKNGLPENFVSITNVSDSDIGTVFLANKDQRSIVTWNPIAMSVLAADTEISNVFDSSEIPGEIKDLCVAKTEVLEKDPRLGLALVGAWYEVLGLMNGGGEEAKAAKASMAEMAEASPAEFDGQLSTTAMFWTPQEAVSFISGPEAQQKMDFVRNFCFKKGLLGEDAASVDVVGIEYPDGTIQGDPNNVKMRFDTRFMLKAAE